MAPRRRGGTQPQQYKTLEGEKLRHALAGNCIQWLKAVRRIHQQITIWSADFHDEQAWHRNDSRALIAKLSFVGEHIMQAHLLVLGLRQIAEYLREMKRVRPGYKSRFKEAAEAFLRDYEREELKACRDFLEHGAEYVAGGGKYRNRVVEIEGHRLGLRFNERSGFRVSIFGTDYRMDGIVRRVDELLAAFDAPETDEGAVRK